MPLLLTPPRSRGLFGDERKPETAPSFMYILHHQLPDAAAGYAADTAAALRVLFSHSQC